MSQDKILSWTNWLQVQLLKSRKEVDAAYSQGYKDALTAAFQVGERLLFSPAKIEKLMQIVEGKDFPLTSAITATCIAIGEGVRSLPIPEAK